MKSVRSTRSNNLCWGKKKLSTPKARGEKEQNKNLDTAGETYLESNCDPQLLLYLVFSQRINLHALKFEAFQDGMSLNESQITRIIKNYTRNRTENRKVVCQSATSEF